MTAKRVLSVGQCGADHAAIIYALKRAFGAEVAAAATRAAALDLLGREGFDLVLVNRVFDADGDSGLDLIRHLRSGEGPHPPVMLVSNYEEAQQKAVAAGAAPGFGKAALGRTPMLERVGAFLK